MTSENTSQHRILVGIPAFNEEKYVGGVVLVAGKHCDEVVVVDDGSTDRTAEIAGLAGATVVRHERNKGYGSSIQRIFAEARERNADILVILDADSQHNPEEIPQLAGAIAGGYDVVVGSRKLQKKNIPTYRRVGQRVLAGLTNVAAGANLSDTESGFRAYSRKAIAELEIKETGMAISAEIISAATLKELKIAEVPITVSYDTDGSTLNPVTHGLGVMQRIFVMISERRPLMFFGILGAVSICIGIFFGVMVVRVVYISQVMQTGTALLSMLFITVGVMVVSTGLILDVLTRRINRH